MPLPAPVTTAEAPWLVVFDLRSSLSSRPEHRQHRSGGISPFKGRNVYVLTGAAPREWSDPGRERRRSCDAVNRKW